MADPRIGLDMKTVVGVNIGLVKSVTSMETPALPAPYGLGLVLQIHFPIGSREGVWY